MAAEMNGSNRIPYPYYVSPIKQIARTSIRINFLPYINHLPLPYFHGCYQYPFARMITWRRWLVSRWLDPRENAKQKKEKIITHGYFDLPFRFVSRVYPSARYEPPFVPDSHRDSREIRGGQRLWLINPPHLVPLGIRLDTARGHYL